MGGNQCKRREEVNAERGRHARFLRHPKIYSRQSLFFETKLGNLFVKAFSETER